MPVKRARLKLLERIFRVLLSVEGLRRLMFGKTMAICEVGVTFLQMAAVGQQNIAQIASRRRCKDWSPEAVFDQKRKIPGMIDMRVGQKHGVDIRRIDWQRAPIALPQLFQTLKEAAVDEIFPVGNFQEIFRTRDRADGAEKGKPRFHRPKPV